jgi:dTDP-glucose 4,6-dehydratase
MTGGTGFFGKSLLSMLKRGFRPDCEFVILSRDPEKFRRSNPEFTELERVSFVAGDVRDFEFPAGRFDWVIHAGNPARVLPPGAMRDVILKGTERVLAFAKNRGVEKLLFTSSGAVYGPQPPELDKIPETFPCSPVTEYGIAKLEAEKMCRASGVYTVMPRCFAFTGPYLDRDIHFAVGNFIRDALSGGPIIIRGDGTPCRSYLYADDLVEWLFALLDRGENGVPYNVGSDRSLSIAELAAAVKNILGSASSVTVEGTPRPDRRPERYVPDISRITSQLGVEVKVPFDEAIRRSAAVGKGA